MEAIVGEVHTLASDLPVPTKFDRFQKRADAAAQLWRDGYDAERGGVDAQRAWIDRHAVLAQMLPTLSRDLATILRPATRGEIAEALTALRENFHNSGKNATANSNRQMAERVGAREPSLGGINLAVLHLMDNEEWYPVTAKVIAALEAATSMLERTAYTLDRIPKLHGTMVKALAESERDQAERQALQITHQRSRAEPPA
jgi:hypothetical protein